MKDKFLLVDGNSLAYRAYYAMPFLTSPDGENTGAIFGFLNMLIKTIEDYDPKYVAVAFDFSKKTFRNEIFKDYKGTRQETPPELKEQFPKIKELLKKMNIKIYEFEGIEADDILVVNDGTYLMGRTAIITEADIKIVFQSHFRRIKVLKKDILSPYLLLALLGLEIGFIRSLFGC